jgi:hypothetical protein
MCFLSPVQESTPLTIAVDVSAVRADVDLHAMASDAALGRTLGFAAEISVVLRCDRSRPVSAGLLDSRIPHLIIDEIIHPTHCNQLEGGTIAAKNES